MPELLKPSEAAQVLGVSRSCVYRMIEEKRMPGATKIEVGWRVVADDLRQHIEDGKTVPKPRVIPDPMPKRGRFSAKVVELESRRSA